MGSFKLLFSDLDGTCVHYQDNEPFKTTIYDSSDDGRLFHARFPNVGPSPGRWTRVLPLPPSTTGAQGIISLKTIELYASLRAMGRKLILISGCRYSTLIQRLPYLPAADAYVCESGGRIFYPDKSLRTAAALKEDMDWRRKHWRAVGVSSPPDDSKFEENEKDKRGIPRLNLLWSYYNFLKLEGLDVDRRNYSTAFRVRISCHEWKDSYPASELYDELAYAENLGAVDIYPATSGKKNAALYLMEKFGGKKNGKDSVFMCDDDNDIELAMSVSKAYLPSITSDSMRHLAETNPERFVVATQKSVFATEEILKMLVDNVLDDLLKEPENNDWD